MLRLGQGCALAVVLVATLTLSEYAGGWDFGTDELLFADPRHGLTAPFPGHMGGE
jgi:hypothetical protein